MITDKNTTGKKVTFLMTIIVVSLLVPMRIHANENVYIHDISSNNLCDFGSDNLVIEENEMQSESSTIIALGFTGENQEIKWSLDSDGLLYVYGIGNNTDLSNLVNSTNKKDMIKYAKLQISGSFDFDDMFWQCSSLVEVNFMDSDYSVLSSAEMFRDCENLKSINFAEIDTSSAENMSGMFSRCYSLETLDLSKFNTGNVKYMSGMFDECHSLKKLDLSKFNTSNVKSMNRMFYGCNLLNELDLTSFNTSNVEEMETMFSQCSSLKDINLASFNTSKVEDMSGMFYGCESLTTLSLLNFDTSNVTDMEAMFVGCDLLKSIDLTSFNTSKVEDMSEMFYGCESLTSLSLSNFDTSNVTDMGQMFMICGSLKSIDLSSFNTSKVENMSGMFYSCSSLETLNLSNFSTNNVTSMSSMFADCYSLKTLDVSNFKTSNVADMESMFSHCYSLKTVDLSSFDTGNVKNMRFMFWFCECETLDLSSFNTSNVLNMQSMFSECHSLKILKLTSFDTSNVEDMSFMFMNCYLLESLDLSNFNTSKVMDMEAMFAGCTTLQNLDASILNVSRVENMSFLFYSCYKLNNIKLFKLPLGNKAKKMDWMFGGCSSLTSVNLSGWNTDTVENMEDMFTDCNKLQTLDLSTFNVENVKSMRYMFNNCTSLQSIIFSGFNTENLTDMTAMFNNCSSLQSIDLSGFKTDKVTSMKYMFYGCESLKNLDISNFYMSSLAYEDGDGMKIFSTMDNIETIKMPANLIYSIALPYEHYIDSTGARKNRKATWYDQSGNQCYSTLTGQSTPVLYRRESKTEIPEIDTPSKSQMITSFVERMYTVVLNRSAEEGGLTYWSGELKNGTGDAATLARGFIGSEEFKARGLDDSAFLDVLYKTFFDRAADGEGKAYWLGELANGSSREFVLSQFVNSREFAEICDSYEIARGTMEADGSSIYNAGVRNFVLRNYTKALGRGGETEGVEYWSHLINTRQMTALDCAMSFFHSQEFLNKNLSDPDYVETLYATYFDRVSDAEGKAYWLNQMQNGMSRDDVLTEFAYSQEFKQIMSGYGL